VNDKGRIVCRKPPTCLPGTHATACGACVPDNSTTTEDCKPPGAGGCWVTGGGFIIDVDGKDTFGGNAMPMKSGAVRGEWEHQEHDTHEKGHGHASYIYCRHINAPGPGQPGGKKGFNMNQVYFGGNARWFTNGGWNQGYWFDVCAEDHGEPGSTRAKGGNNPTGGDYYHYTIRKVAGANQSGTIIYETKGYLSGGNIQIHPPNNGHPYVSTPLPAWVQLEH
jgi:hypothetical protein